MPKISRNARNVVFMEPKYPIQYPQYPSAPIGPYPEEV
jgi:hypothetical protein